MASDSIVDGQRNVTRLTGSRILIVEDDDAVAGLLLKVLTRAGYNITEAGDGLTALNLFKHCDFDLVLTDVIMPELSGPLMVKEMSKVMRSKGTRPLHVRLYGRSSRTSWFRCV